MSAEIKLPERHLDARTFQAPLSELANTLALKVQREGPGRLPNPAFVIADIYMLLRQAHHIHDLFFYLNADERRQKDGNWRLGYSTAILPLVRCLIDCLYNVTVILENPGAKGFQFRESGYKQMLQALDADEHRYGGEPKWDDWITRLRREIDLDMRMHGFTEAAVRAARTWPTLSGYLRVKKGTPLTPHQEFLKKLTFGFWQEYSGMAHATFQGLAPTAIFYTPQDLPHEVRPQVETASEIMISIHVPRVAGILLCMLTEVQAYFRFDGAHINQRLHQVWNALIPVPEIKELYDERYAKLMEDINPD